jgi:flagellar brake protein
MSTESDYLVRNAKTIFGHLTDIVKSKCLISAHFGEYNASFLTTIIDLDQKKNLVQLDCGPSAALDNQLLESNKVLFRTEVEGIKVSFSGKDIKKVKHGDDWAFSMPIPSSIFWMQRRQFYRVKIPLSHTSSYCRLAFPSENEDDTDQIVPFPLCDISLTGFAFLAVDPKVAQRLQPDIEFVDCTLNLHSGNQAKVSFVVKNIATVRTNSAIGVQHRIGCQTRFLPPSFETSIQRYMQEIELQQKNIG